MSCCLSVYFLVVFKTVLRGLWTFSFVGLKIIFRVLFIELGGLLTTFVTRLCLATSRLVETLVASVSSGRAQVTCSSPSVLLSPSTFGLSTSGYTDVSRITRNFLTVSDDIQDARVYKMHANFSRANQEKKKQKTKY